MPRCLVVMYHYVREPARLGVPCRVDLSRGVRGLTPAAFEEQLDELSRRLEPLNWTALHRACEGEGSLPDDSFLLTFDDGLADHARVVCPILERRGLRGTFFVPTGMLDRRTILAAHAVHLLLAALGDDGLEEELTRAARRMGFDGAPHAAADPRYDYEAPRRAALKQRIHFGWSPRERERILDDLVRRHLGDPAEWSRTWYVGAEDLRRMQSAGHTIGGHGHTHDPLARMSRSEQEADLRSCWEHLTRTLGARPRPLSYPFGSLSPDTPSCAQRAGFTHGFTTESQWLSVERPREQSRDRKGAVLLHNQGTYSKVSPERPPRPFREQVCLPGLPGPVLEQPFRIPRVDAIHVRRQLNEPSNLRELEPCP